MTFSAETKELIAASQGREPDLVKTTFPARCPRCDADMDGGPIPEQHRSNYAGDRFGRIIAIVEDDRFSRWKCPDCGHQWR